MANHVLLVTQLDLPCLRNVVRLMMSFGEMEGHQGQGQDRRQPRRLDSHISLKKAQETIGREIFWQLPNDYRTMVEVRNNGVPLIEQAPKAAITQSIVALADALCGDRRRRQKPPTIATQVGRRQAAESLAEAAHGTPARQVSRGRCRPARKPSLRRRSAAPAFASPARSARPAPSRSRIRGDASAFHRGRRRQTASYISFGQTCSLARAYATLRSDCIVAMQSADRRSRQSARATRTQRS